MTAGNHDGRHRSCSANSQEDFLRMPNTRTRAAARGEKRGRIAIDQISSQRKRTAESWRRRRKQYEASPLNYVTPDASIRKPAPEDDGQHGSAIGSRSEER